MDVESLHGRRATARWERLSVGDLFERVTWSYPDKDAIIGWDGAYASRQRLTYTQADALANQVANALLARGLTRGDKVLMICDNSVEAWVTKIGIAKAGLTVAPLNPALAPDVIAHIVGFVEPAFTIVDAEFWTKAADAFAGRPPDVTIPIGGQTIDGSASYDDWLADAPTTEPDVAVHADDIWELIFTSGTTSMPKGAMVSHQYSYIAGYGMALSYTRGLRFEADLRLIAFLPLIFHIGDQIMGVPPFLCGGTLVIGRRFAPDQLALAITRTQSNALYGGSPGMLQALVTEVQRNPHRYDLTSVCNTLYAWSALSPGLLRALKDLCGEDLVAFEVLGQTECISCLHFWPDKWIETFRATAPESNYVGVPSPNLASDLFDAEGNSLRGTVGVPGEAVYRGPGITSGYYRDLPATQDAFRGGWFHTGDTCVYDSDGLRIMVDRSKDMVKSGGENVSSQRVEAVVVQHPDVVAAAVVGLPHEHWGEAVTAFVVADEGCTVDPDAVLAFARTRLAGFETPKRVVVIDALPVTVGNKVLKYKLRQQWATLYA